MHSKTHLKNVNQVSQSGLLNSPGVWDYWRKAQGVRCTGEKVFLEPYALRLFFIYHSITPALGRDHEG